MSRTVLIVDDSKLSRMAVAKILRALRPHWAQVEAASAAEARRHIRERAADVVLLDFDMPGENGLALGAELRHAYPEVRIAIISASWQTEVVEGAQHLGATYLSKPLSEAALGAFLGSLF